MLSEIKLSLPYNDNFTMLKVIYNYLCLYSFIDNKQKELYNIRKFQAKSEEGEKVWMI